MEQVGSLESLTECLETCLPALPSQVLYRLKDRRVQPQGSECAKQEGVVPGAEERFGKPARAADRCGPLLPTLWDVLKMTILREHRGRCFGAPSSNAGIAVGTIADDGEVVGDRLRLDSESFHHTGFIPHCISHAIQLHHPRADDTL